MSDASRRGPGGIIAGPGPGRGPMRGMLAGGAKARDFSGSIRKLFAYLGRYRPAMAVVMVLALASTVFTIAGPKILGQATTKLFEGVMAQVTGTGSIDFKAISQILILTLALYLIASGFSYIQGWIMSGVAVNISYRFRRDISQKINRMPLAYFDGTSHGEVLSRITNDVDTVNQSLSQSLVQIITSTATVFGVLIMMLSISWLLTLVVLVIVPLSLIFVTLIVKRSQKLFKQQQSFLGQLNGHVEEMYGNHFIMKAFNGEARSIREFEKFNNGLYNTAWKSQFLSGLMMPMMNVIGNIGYVGITILGGHLVIKRLVSLGDIQAFIQYVRSFNHPLTQLANISNILQQAAAAAERVFEFLAEAEESPETPEVQTTSGINGHVEFQGVHFSYSPDKPVIKGLSAKAERGQKIAIVGPTGAGKTTLVKLLMRFYDLNQGSIHVDNIDINQFTRKDLRQLFAIVLQDAWLFNGTIMENIRYGRPEADDEAVYEAARTAHADHFIRALPLGYEMVINEEADNISLGQKQLLTIARAILADPKMLILDEATSSVDSHTELLIQKAMDRLMAGRTSFIIAHRLSTIKNADLILVLQNGDIVEQGSHNELLARDSFYADIYKSQFEDSVAN